MTDPLPSGPRREAQTGAEDDTRIEHLLVTGLDHYFAGEFEAAINLWTRVLFLDRNHDRARAYIDRARSAQAEQHRVSEALVHQGLEAFDRGEVVRARALLSDALDQGASHDLALGVLGRIDRLDVGEKRSPAEPPPIARRRVLPSRRLSETPGADRRLTAGTWIGLVAVATLVGAVALYYDTPLNLAGFWPATPAADRPFTATVTPAPLPVPLPAETYLREGRALFASGKLRDALRAVERVPVGDSLRQDADRLRGEIQRELLAVASAEGSAPAPLTSPPGRPPE
jgi:tetratricopeptide (TPR) repeat protein